MILLTRTWIPLTRLPYVPTPVAVIASHGYLLAGLKVYEWLLGLVLRVEQ